MIETYDEIIADRGFQIREYLVMYMATLCIPPSDVSIHIWYTLRALGLNN